MRIINRRGSECHANGSDCTGNITQMDARMESIGWCSKCSAQLGAQLDSTE